MGNQIPAETVELIRKACELDLPAKSGAVFAGVNVNTYKKWEGQIGPGPTVKHYGRLQWSENDITEQLRRIRAQEGISGVWAENVNRNHRGVYEATWNFNGYPGAFKNAFGFPFSKAAKYLAERIQESQENGEEITPALLSKERQSYRQVIEKGYFNAVLRFVTENPVVRKRTEREVYEALARVILRYLPGPDSFITADMKHVFPPQYREEAEALLGYATQIGLLIPASVNGATIYRASTNAIPRIRETIGYSHGEDISAINWWNSVCETQGPEGCILRGMETVLEKLSAEDRAFVQPYLMRALCNPQTYDTAKDTYKPRNPDFRRASTIAETVIQFRGEDGVPPELYPALRLLPPEDYRTAIVFGELLIKSRAGEDWLGILRDISSQDGAELAYQAAAKHGIYFPPHANNLSYSRH